MSIAVVVITEPILGFERYGISREGDIYDFERKRFVIPLLNSGYYKVNLTNVQKQYLMYVHRLLAIAFIPNPNNLPCVDHRDRDKTNNSISNLRWCTHQENMRNKTKQTGTTSQYNGVSWHKREQHWVAQIKFNYKQIHLGYFDTEEEAALAYNNKSQELFGEYANTNDIEDVLVI